MESNSKRKKLLYVSDVGTNEVQVYNYPKGTPAGTLTGFGRPEGECVDSRGDIFITDFAGNDILEYAHGGSSPIATISDPNQQPGACSVNKKTGDLAVANFGSGSLSVYRHATGTPTLYSDPSFENMWSVGYDDKDNLFVDGTNASAAFQYAELPKGSATFTSITLVGATINTPGGVQWDGHDVAVGDLDGTIYQTSGGTVLGSTTLTGACAIWQFFIDKGRVVAPDNCNVNADTYKYPAGGSPIKAITTGLTAPWGAALSR